MKYDNNDDTCENMEVMMLSIACRNQTGTLKGIEQVLSWTLFGFLLSEYLVAKYQRRACHAD